MPCKTCTAPNGLAVCLFCGHSFCGPHRGERDGAIACTACQEAEHARASGRAQAGKAVESSRVAAIGTPVSDRLPGVTATTTAQPAAPLRPIAEAGWWPILAGAAAAAVTGAYLWFFLVWLTTGVDGVPVWARPAGTSVGALIAFTGVWIITKSRLS